MRQQICPVRVNSSLSGIVALRRCLRGARVLKVPFATERADLLHSLHKSRGLAQPSVLHSPLAAERRLAIPAPPRRTPTGVQQVGIDASPPHYWLNQMTVAVRLFGLVLGVSLLAAVAVGVGFVAILLLLGA